MNEHRAPLTSVHLVVRDMAATVAFYRALGVSIPDERIWSVAGQGHRAEVPMPSGFVLELDSVELTRSYDPSWRAAEAPGPSLIVFAMPSRPAVDAVYRTLVRAGHRGHLAPFDAFWGARYAVVLDPDGNAVGLMSPSEDSHKRPPALAGL